MAVGRGDERVIDKGEAVQIGTTTDSGSYGLSHSFKLAHVVTKLEAPVTFLGIVEER